MFLRIRTKTRLFLAILTHIYTVAEWNYFTRKENAGTMLYEFKNPSSINRFTIHDICMKQETMGVKKTYLISACNCCELEPT